MFFLFKQATTRPGYLAAYSSTISLVPSVEQSSITLTTTGNVVFCMRTLSIASAMYFAWLYVISRTLTLGRRLEDSSSGKDRLLYRFLAGAFFRSNQTGSDEECLSPSCVSTHTCTLPTPSVSSGGIVALTSAP